MQPNTAKPRTALDMLAVANAPKAFKNLEVRRPTLDDADGDFDSSPAADYTLADINLKAASAINEWVEASDLADGETSADRLMAMFVGIADMDQSGELDDDEQDVISAALNAGFDYLTSNGVSEDDAEALLSDWSPDVADRVRELLASTMGDDDGSSIDSFAFGAYDQEPALDATYHKAMVIRHGKRVRINKRISGKVHLSSAQKVAIAKMQRRSHSAGAMTRRRKSAAMSRKMGL